MSTSSTGSLFKSLP